MPNNLNRLLHHWKLRARIRLSRAGETLRGIKAFLLWVPRLLRSLPARTRQRPQQSGGTTVSVPKLGSQNFPVFFINLAHRKDRLEETTGELAKLGIRQSKRIPGVRRRNGALGCAESHIKCLDALAGRKFQLAMICEDDIEFLVERTALEALLSEFLRTSDLGVLCIANRVRGPVLPVGPSLSISNNIQMAACYVIKPFALTPLKQSFLASAMALRAGAPLHEASIDQQWKQVQTREVFFAVPRELVARQRESHSDIVGRVKRYH